MTTICPNRLAAARAHALADAHGHGWAGFTETSAVNILPEEGDIDDWTEARRALAQRWLDGAETLEAVQQAFNTACDEWDGRDWRTHPGLAPSLDHTTATGRMQWVSGPAEMVLRVTRPTSQGGSFEVLRAVLSGGTWTFSSSQPTRDENERESRPWRQIHGRHICTLQWAIGVLEDADLVVPGTGDTSGTEWCERVRQEVALPDEELF
jgi:hypothetical protein